MTISPLATKLKLKAGQKATVVGAPVEYLKELFPLPKGIQLSDRLDGKYDWLQVYMINEAEMDVILSRILASLQAEILVWLSFPKGSSKIPTYLTRDKGWDSLRGAYLKWINLVSVNATWSAFNLHPYRTGEANKSFR